MTQETGLTLLTKEKPTLTQLALINMPRGSSLQDAERIVTKECANLGMILEMRPDLRNCSPLSMVQCVKQTINDNLTLAPSAALVYLYPSFIATDFDTAKNVDIKEWIMVYDPTANGRLSRARQAGRVLDNKHPVPTFDATGKVISIKVEFLVPSHPQPRWDEHIFYEWNFERWRQASEKKNGKAGANKSYTSHNGGIDPGFAASKAIRHGLERRGTNMNERLNPAVQMDFKGVPAEAAYNESRDEFNGTIQDVSHEVISSSAPATSNTESVNSEDL